MEFNCNIKTLLRSLNSLKLGFICTFGTQNTAEIILTNLEQLKVKKLSCRAADFQSDLPLEIVLKSLPAKQPQKSPMNMKSTKPAETFFMGQNFKSYFIKNNKKIYVR